MLEVRTFLIITGINLPKIIDCIGSNGETYTQLLKSNDDLRQGIHNELHILDAVMEQVFGMVDLLLCHNVESRRRRLLIRTYLVIPLSPRSGLLQWVSNTSPIREYLHEAHERLNPGDLRPDECRKIMDMAHKDRLTKPQTVIETYKAKIMPSFTPIQGYGSRRD